MDYALSAFFAFCNAICYCNRMIKQLVSNIGKDIDCRNQKSSTGLFTSLSFIILAHSVVVAHTARKKIMGNIISRLDTFLI